MITPKHRVNLLVCSFCEGYSFVKIENMDSNNQGIVKFISIEKCPLRCNNGFT